MWPALTVVAFAALVFVHFWWRRRFREAEQTAQREIVEFTRRAGQRAGFPRAEDGTYVEPWYYYSFRTIANTSSVQPLDRLGICIL